MNTLIVIILGRKLMCNLDISRYLLIPFFNLTLSSFLDMLASKKVSVTKAQSFPQADFLAAIAAAETGKAAVLKI